MALNRFLNALPDGDRGEAAIVGVPFDGTASYRPGARFGPSAIRAASHSLETYSSFINKDLEGRDVVDSGDLELSPGDVEGMLDRVESKTNDIIERDMRPIILGGEHTATLGVVRALSKVYPDLMVIHLDSHADFKDEYLGSKINHATVMKRVADTISNDRIIKIGVRSGTKEELRDAGLEVPIPLDSIRQDWNDIINNIPEGNPIYVSLDLDVFDPSLVPGVGNPEPYGLTWREFIQITRVLTYKNFVGFDVMELTPKYDSTGVSAVVAASVVRDLTLSLLA